MPNHHSVDAAVGWVDATAHHLDTEDAPLRTGRRRVLTEDIRAVRPIPASDRAALDGFAVQASASLGASTYNPVRLPLIAVAAGDALPAGTDAVVPLESAERDEGAYIEVVEATATGHNVEQQGAVATIGATLVPGGTQLAARHIGLLTIAGLSGVPVVRRPRVRMLVEKPATVGAWEDSNGPMIRASVERDGGVIGECVAVERDLMAIRAALIEAGADIVLVIGGTGPGSDDHSAAALAEAGELAIHGVARRVRHRRDPFDGPGNRRVQSPIPDPGAGARIRLSPLARDRLPQRRPTLRGAVLSRTQLAARSPERIV